MAEIRFNYGDKFTQTSDSNTGIGSTIPAAKLDIAGGTSAGSLRVSGIATLPSYQGFVNTKLNPPTEGMIVEAGQSGSVSGEVVIGTGQTISVSTGATTGQGGVHSLKVFETFMPPVGGTADRPTDVKPGMLYYNKDFKTIEFWDGNFWKQVDNITTRGRAVFGGGWTGDNDALSQISYVNIMSLGNALEFGDLVGNARSGAAPASSSVRGLFMGGGSPTRRNDIDYITIASEGNGIDFGNLTESIGFMGGSSSSTRGLRMGGTTPSKVNTIDYVEMATLGDALDFGDLTEAPSACGGLSSPTRGFRIGGSTPTFTSTIDVFTIASKGNAVKFGDMTTQKDNSRGNVQSTTRGIIAGGRPSPGAGFSFVEFITMASEGNSTMFGDLTRAHSGPAGASNQVRGIFYAGGNSTPYTNVIDFITIATTGNGQDFGDATQTTNNAAGLSDSHGGLGGF